MDALVSLSCFRLLWVLCVLVFIIYSNDVNTIFGFSYPNLCLHVFVYQDLTLKVNITSNMYSMFMVFAIHGLLEEITRNYICQVFYWTYFFCFNLTYLSIYRFHILLSWKCINFKRSRSTIPSVNRYNSSWYCKRHTFLASDLVHLNKHHICILLVLRPDYVAWQYTFVWKYTVRARKPE